jgi:hypothetical protein
MAHLIRKTSFTWDPDRESRAELRARIRTHVQQELDRIHAEHMLARRIARHQARPNYQRNQEIVAAARQGIGDRELSGRYGISRQWVRQIIRNDTRWLARNGPDRISGEYRHPAQCGMPYDRDVATAVPRTLMVLLGP